MSMVTTAIRSSFRLEQTLEKWFDKNESTATREDVLEHMQERWNESLKSLPHRAIISSCLQVLAAARGGKWICHSRHASEPSSCGIYKRCSVSRDSRRYSMLADNDSPSHRLEIERRRMLLDNPDMIRGRNLEGP